mmetsp:Transcript_44578/g.32675  ORF Transcript_44578/g.32675 Transcript_44578/m.32675 type:complete len:143 (+) Transcript_44578:370-798(+)|eukprot:CAMPEP_0202972172 /NCGR_PEP_ID=MMETSP1396-20130829/33914_1 /ASSEMBLY_ACC=CAM_ASM_000872 /TAXON_ID= /ORGANISM="Pseudokeronopsis sp., Strain Brazil" /LENGTH=142 /DNA_ID=CAMNT_0049702281 /DNA_START=277 /DNA_END=705 /DNA_ORIENTATION=-
MSEESMEKYRKLQQERNQTSPQLSISALKKYLEVGLFDEEDPVIFQGELLKLKPGINFQYQPRWLQVTRSSFRYYKSRWTQNSNLQKPLNAVPIVAIKYITKLDPETKKDYASASTTKMYRFELVLKEDFLNIYFDPYYDIC